MLLFKITVSIVSPRYGAQITDLTSIIARAMLYLVAELVGSVGIFYSGLWLITSDIAGNATANYTVFRRVP